MLRSKRCTWTAGLMASTAMTLLLAACGSSGTSGPSGSDSTQSASKPSGNTASQVAAAKAYVARYAAPPTKIPVTTPIQKPTTPGRTVVYLQCTDPQCAQIGNAITSGAAAVGWTVKRISYDTADPATLVAGMKQALQFHPVGVVFAAAFPYAAWASEVPAYTAAHVPLVPWLAGDVPSNPIIPATMEGNDVLKAHADLLANWFIADSNGTGKALLYAIPDIPGLLAVQTEFQAAVKAGCTACSVEIVKGTLGQLAAGGVNAAIVAALRRDSSLQYLIMSNYQVTQGIPAALQAAGISGTKIGGLYTGVADETLIKQGDQQAGTPQPLNIPGWLTIDALIRYSEGMSATDSGVPLPLQLLTKSNVGTPSDSYDFPTDYQEQFKKLWRVG